jgi:GGDEF domain-containing protein
VTNLRRSIFWAALYLAVVVVLGQTDYFGKPIINFASYFYMAVLIGVPATLFFPSIARVTSFVPLAVWAVIYVGLTLLINRRQSTTLTDTSVIVLEFLVLEVGIWFAHQLAMQIAHAESVMDELAISAFPNRAQEMEEGSQRIKIEFTRSRRYHRPLSVVIIEVDPDHQSDNAQVIRSIQHDLTNRFISARVGQIIEDRIRQTDLVMRDRRWRYIILCPETDLPSVMLLTQRITQSIQEKTGLNVLWGAAAFPEESLTFEDLLDKARGRMLDGSQSTLRDIQASESVGKEIV